MNRPIFTHNIDHRCKRCQTRRPKKGGEYRVSADGLRQVWVCAWCIERERAKQ